MNRRSERPPAIPAPWQRVAMSCGLVSVAVLGAWLWWSPGAGRGAAPNTLGWAIAVLALALSVLAAGATLALRRTATQHRMADELRDARERLRCIDELLDVWQWQTDSQHRVVQLRPPRGAAAADWAAPAAASLWEVFKPGSAVALRAQLSVAAPLDDIEVERDRAGGALQRGRLRGRARTDATGQFAGYQGTWQPLDAAGAPRPMPAAHALPGATLPLTRVPAHAGPSSAPSSASEHESFSFTVSHDLRAPIRVVEGFTKIVKEDYGHLLDRVGNDHLDRVLGAAARMNNMIDALLALAKLSSQPLARQPVNLSQLATYVADDMRRQWPGRQVKVMIEPGMQVQGDPTLLRVVVENLMGNAWKYSAKAAQAQIWFERSAAPDTFCLRDNGAGFDMRFADRLFGVFQRLHSANDFPGTGVGLASVRRIVRRHGGEIWGDAEVMRGARFQFTLPQGDAPTQRA